MASKLQLFFLAASPALFTVLLAVLYITPKPISGFSAVMPLLHLTPIYLWSVLHARHMPLWFVVLLGIVIDTASGQLMGSSSFTYCLFIILVRSQRKYILKEGFFGLWGYFGLSMLLLQLANWQLIWLNDGSAPPMDHAAWQWAFSVMVYPLLHGALYPLVDKIADKRYRLLHS